MLYNFQRKKLCSHLLVGGALLVAGLGMYSCTEEYDLGDKQPTGLDNIYGYMQDKGNFKNYLRLIDDLGQAEILSKTGSKTMFIADDDAFTKFYASNDWGVKSYDQLTVSQKKLLLNSSMIDNPYSTSMLSSAAGADLSPEPLKGEVCRRASSQTLYDSITVVASKSAEADAILPHNARFDAIRSYNDSIVLFFDDKQSAPMLHFTGKFIATNKLETQDVDFIYNQSEGTFNTDDVYVNNSRVIESNIFCKNGFIHQVDKVIMPLDNIAEIIRKSPKMSIYNSIIERFAAPDSTKSLTDKYNVNKGVKVNYVYNKRYFSNRSVGSSSTEDKAYETDKDQAAFDASLKFDPGWNGYVSAAFNDREAMMEDMAVMLVPTDAAFNDWWNNGGGLVIKDFYKEIDSVPNAVFDDLINVGQLSSFISSVPSRFKTDVLNDANEPMGITKEDIDSVYLGCNGLVYLTNKVFAPTSYSSVLFPAVIDTEKFSVIANAIEQLNYDKYLNSMVSRYIFLLPTNNGLLSYVDPVSYGQTESQLWEFYLDPSKAKSQQLCANVYSCEYINGKWQKTSEKALKNVTGGANSGVLKNRIENLLDNIIVVEGYQEGKQYYRTKARTYVKVEKVSDSKYLVSGSMQNSLAAPLPTCEDGVYHMDNGLSLVLDGPIMGTNQSVAMTLANAEGDGSYPFTEFYSIMSACGALSRSNSKDGWQAGDQNDGNLFNIKEKGVVGNEGSSSSKATYLLNNYNYTIYAPTNEAMQKAYDAGLPTLEDLFAAEEYDEENGISEKDSASTSAKIKEAMLDFVKYHIQDNSIFVDKGFESGDYPSGKTELLLSVDVAEGVAEEDLVKYNYDPSRLAPNGDGTYTVYYYPGTYTPGRPYKLTVNVSENGMTVTDCRNGYDKNQKYLGGNTANVITKPGMYNIMAAEYWYTASSKVTQPWTVNLNNMSSVVIHAIDSPLIYADGQHLDSNGNPAATQFIYTYKPLYKDK